MFLGMEVTVRPPVRPSDSGDTKASGYYAIRGCGGKPGEIGEYLNFVGVALRGRPKVDLKLNRGNVGRPRRAPPTN